MAKQRTALGRRIAAACALKGWTMTKLADEIDVSRNTITRIVTGDTADPATGIMVKIARALGTTVEALVGTEDTTGEMLPTTLALVGAED